MLVLGCGSTVGDAGFAGVAEPVTAGLVDAVAASVVLIVGGDVADPGVQRTVLYSARTRSSSASRTPGSVIFSRCGQSPLTCPNKLSIQAWVRREALSIRVEVRDLRHRLVAARR